MNAVAYAGAAAAIVTSAQFVPQALKTARGGTLGVSLWTWSLFVATTTGWLAFGLTAGLWPMIVVNAVAAPAAWFVAVKITFHQRHRWPIGAGGVAVGAAIAVLATHSSSSAAGVLAVIEVAATFPQLASVLGHRDISGVSAGSWMVTVAAQTLWLIWGVLADQTAVAAGGGAIAVVAAVISWRVQQYQRRVSTPAA